MSAPGKLEKGLAIVLLLLSTEAFLNLFLKHGKFIAESNAGLPISESNAGLPFMQLIWSGLYLMVFLFLIKEARGFWQVLLRGWPFLLLLTICLLSIFWSDAKGLTARRSVALIPTTFTGFYLAIRYSFKEQLKLLMTLFKASIVLSIIFGAVHLGTPVDSLSNQMNGVFIQNRLLSVIFDVLPLHGVFAQWTEPWYGIFTQRNSLGMIMALSTVVFLLWSRLEPDERWSAYLWTGLSSLLIILSGSMTAYLSLFGVLIVGCLLRDMRLNPQRARRVLVASIVAAGIALSFIAQDLGTVTAFFDRDATLTGRTTIWGASLLLGMDHPWIGHGFNAFWLGDEGPSGEIRRLAGWDVPSAHNGYLETWLDLGICGLVALVLGLAVHFWKSMQYFFQKEGGDGYWPVLYLAFLTFINFVQSALISPNAFFWILYVVISARLCLADGKSVTEMTG